MKRRKNKIAFIFSPLFVAILYRAFDWLIESPQLLRRERNGEGKDKHISSFSRHKEDDGDQR